MVRLITHNMLTCHVRESDWRRFAAAAAFARRTLFPSGLFSVGVRRLLRAVTSFDSRLASAFLVDKSTLTMDVG
jgi:hypothetical protein